MTMRKSSLVPCVVFVPYVVFVPCVSYMVLPL
nr:MAG TPA: hypothetical protein [Herelleviridae sp.]